MADVGEALQRMFANEVSILQAGCAHAGAAGIGDPVSYMVLGHRDGAIEPITVSLRDARFLVNKLLAGLAHFGDAKAKQICSQLSSQVRVKDDGDNAEPFSAPGWQPKRRFRSDLRPTGMSLARWEENHWEWYSLLGGYELPDLDEWIVLVRRDCRPRQDMNVHVTWRNGRCLKIIDDEHPYALQLQGYMWRWFGNIRPGSKFVLGHEGKKVRKLGRKPLQRLMTHNRDCP